MAFVLTGKDDWKQWSRDALYDAIIQTGHTHSEKIRGPQDTLVSSRGDTVKAIQAAAKGASVITYAELHSFLNGGGHVTVTGLHESREMLTGEFKLIWTNCIGEENYQIFPCMHDALEHAGMVHGVGGKCIWLINWMHELACPSDQLQELAMLRSREQAGRAATAEMHNIPEWGSM